MRVEIRTCLERVFPYLAGSEDSNSDHQDWKQALFLAEPFCLTLVSLCNKLYCFLSTLHQEGLEDLLESPTKSVKGEGTVDALCL